MIFTGEQDRAKFEKDLREFALQAFHDGAEYVFGGIITELDKFISQLGVEVEVPDAFVAVQAVRSWCEIARLEVAFR
jgi:hypothetical protein